MRAEVAADRGEIGRFRGELREQVEFGERGGDQVDGVKAVAEAIDFQRVVRGRTGKVERRPRVTSAS